MLFVKSFLTFCLISGLLITAPVGCKSPVGEEPAVLAPPARTLVSSSLIGEYSTDQLRSRFSGASSFLRVFVQHSIKAYRLEYNTTNTDGKVVRASGALIVPNVTTAAPMLSMQHGTITNDNDAPSYFRSGSEAYTFGSVFASQGYIIVAPDYIGYGASNNLLTTWQR